MAYEQREWDGILFRNDKKGNERAPDWTGNVVIRGEKFRLAAWTKTGRGGEFLSLKPSEEEAREPRREMSTGAPERGRAPPPKEDIDDDIPF